MNNQEQEFYTVVRDGKEIKIPASEFTKPAGLSLPTQSYDTYQEHLEDEARLMADWNAHAGQPTVPMNKDPYLSGDYNDPMEAPVQEQDIYEGGLPSLSNSKLDNNRRLQ